MINFDDLPAEQHKIVSSQQMKAIDRHTIHQLGVPGIVLMHQAGKRAFEIITHRFPVSVYPHIAVLCGGGNNGGDGFVIAKYLFHAGYVPTIYLLKDIESLSADAVLAWKMVECLPIEHYTHFNATAQLGHTDLIIDAMIGTGFSGKIKKSLAILIEQLNRQPCPIVAIDIPSGLNCDLETKQISVKAALTITFGFPKIAQLLFPAAAQIGDLHVATIGFSQESWIKLPRKSELIVPLNLDINSLKRSPNTHKGTFGHLLIIGGSNGMLGAPFLAAESALNSGAGLVTVVIPQINKMLIPAYNPSLMVLPLPGNNLGFTHESAKYLLNWLKEKNISGMVIGMGIGQQPETIAFVDKMVKQTTIPVVIDADALRFFQLPQDNNQANNRLIATPHPKEYNAYFTGGKTAESISSLNAMRKICHTLGIHLIYKTSRTCYVTPDDDLFILVGDNPGMATAGMGDVLAGMIGVFASQNKTIAEGVKLALAIHSIAGFIGAEKYSYAGLTADKVAQLIPEAIKCLLSPNKIEDASLPFRVLSN